MRTPRAAAGGIALAIVVTALAMALSAGQAKGAPPAGGTPDPEISAWYKSLRDSRGIPCCDVSDCRPVVYRAGGETGTEVFIDRASYGAAAPNAWVPVPPEAVLPRDNPTGSAVACYYAGRVACFIRGIEG